MVCSVKLLYTTTEGEWWRGVRRRGGGEGEGGSGGGEVGEGGGA